MITHLTQGQSRPLLSQIGRRLVGLVLLTVTFLVELPSTLWRLFVGIILGMFLLNAGIGSSGSNFGFAALFAIYPILLAGLTLLLPFDLLTPRMLGARKPSRREQEVIDIAVQQLYEPGSLPRRWYIVDSPGANAYVVGWNIYIEHGLLSTPYLAPVIAHELGHLNSIDGALVLALRRLMLPSSILYALADKDLYGNLIDQKGLVQNILFFGGWGVRIWPITWMWNGWYRDSEFAADSYAANCGQAAQLIEALEALAQPYDVAVPFMIGRAHPYTEQRIERLYKYLVWEQAQLEPA